MRLLTLLALAGAVTAFSIRDWTYTEQEMTYKLVSQVLTGIPQLDSQYAGWRLSGVSRCQPQSDGSIKIKLDNMKYSSVNDKIQVSEEREIVSPSEQELPSHVRQALESPFKVVLTPSGKIEEIQTESNEPEMITNIKKSLINGANFDWLEGSRMIDTNLIHRDVDTDWQPKTYFEMMEKNIEGECEVEYSVNKMAEYQIREFQQKEGSSSYCQDKEHYQVVKSVNYQNCKDRPIYQRSVGTHAKSDGTSGYSSPFITESSVTRSVWCGTIQSPVLRKQTTEQKVVVSANGKFDSQEKIEVTSRVSSKLISVAGKSTEIPDVQSPKRSKDLTFSYPSGDFWSSPSSARSQYRQHLPQPSDMTSAPLNPFPSLSQGEAKQRFITKFVSMIELSKRSESAHAQKDVASQTSDLSYLSSMLSYQDILDCWSRIHQQLRSSLALKETAINVFCDILAMAPSNPSIKFIAEKIKNKQIKGESAAWIAANIMRSVKTPTEQTIQELNNLLKHSTVQQNRDLRATVSMSLTEMIYRACIDETSSRYNYPTKMYGKFCSKTSKVIRKELIPHLKQSLTDLKSELSGYQPSTANMNKLITLINSLGNLGMEEASKPLLEVIEGRYTLHPHPRSVAVYKLIRSAKNNPTKYRPVLLSIINNNAESEEVRMAAVAALPYVQPSSAQLQKLAVLTWFDSSKQVSSFITSTLKSIAALPTASYESLTHLSQKAGEALKLAKPIRSGIHKSQNIKIQQFLDTLKAAVGLKLQYVNSAESAFPKFMYIKSEISSKAQTMQPFETSVYLQGTDTVLDKLYSLYQAVTQVSQPEKPEEKLNFEPRQSAKPEAHVTLKMFDMQRLFSVDTQYIQEAFREISQEMIEENNAIKRDFMKVLDLSHHFAYLPTVSGVPLYLHQRVPLVMTAHTSITSGRAGTIEIKTKPVFNYKQNTQVGALCPFTKEYLGAGVSSSLHVTVPLRADLSLRQGQVSVTLKTPGDSESQKDKAVVQLKVRPYTNKLLFDPQQTHRQETKTIHTKYSQRQSQYQLGQRLGVDLKLKVETEHQFSDLASILGSLSFHKPLTFLSLPLPLRSCRSHTVSLTYSPSSSQTKEASFIFSLGYGSKDSLFGQVKMHYPPEIGPDQDITEKQCEQEKDQWQEVIEEDSLDDEEERKYWSQTSQDSYRQKLKQKLENERKVHSCVKVKKCEQVESQCREELRGENRPSEEVERLCDQKKTECVQQQKSKMSTKTVLYKLSSGSAVTCSAALILRTENNQRKLEVRTTVGRSHGRQARTKVQITGNMEQHEMTFITTSKMDKPESKWDKMSILRQELSGAVDMKLRYGERSQTSQAKQTATASIKLYQSAEQKKFAVESHESARCQRVTGRLTEDCKVARQHASSLDTIQATFQLPRSWRENVYLKTVSQLSQAYVAPYIQHLQYNQPQDTVRRDNQYLCSIKIHPKGEKFSVSVQSKESDMNIKDIRVVEGLHGLLPFNLEESGSHNVIQALTSHQAPSTCAIEEGKIKTFDNLHYEYQINDCEHVVFKDCSQSSRVEVTAQQKDSHSHVKVTLDNHKYELRFPSGGKPIIKVNDEEKQYIQKQDYESRKVEERKIQSQKYQESPNQNGEWEKELIKREKSEFAEQKHNYYNDKTTYVTSYKDGVYAVVNQAYGISVYSDGKSLEIKTYQHLLRNKACGLCGDLNDETVADVKTPSSCILSSPSLAALTYMVQDQSCQGVPSHHQDKINSETQQCIKKEDFPSQVSQVFYHQHTPVYSKHLVEEKANKICFSTEQVKVCPSNSSPEEIKEKKVSFYCLSKDSKSVMMQKMAEQGEFIPYQYYKYPTSFQRTISTPTKC